MSRWFAAAALALAGGSLFAAARAQPPLPVDPRTAPPHYYAIAASGPMAQMDGARMCAGGAAMRADLARMPARDPKARAEALKGCTHKIERLPDGGLRTRMDCDLVAGAAHDVHMTTSVSGGVMHAHSRMTIKGPDGRDKVIVNDRTLTDLGPCPADVKPGQYRLRDGKLVDMATLLQRRTGRGAAAPPR